MEQRDRLIELISKIQYMGGLEEKLADHLLANGVIVPPCKVGDTVYYINTYPHIALLQNTIYEARVVRFVTLSGGTSLVIHIKDENGVCEVPNISDWGITVFPTKEEAERELERRKK